MAVFPTRVFTQDNVFVRWRAPYTTDVFNKKAVGYPRGVYFGFNPVANGGDPANLLDLLVDPTEGFSLLRVKSEDSAHLIDIFVESTIQLDFTGHGWVAPNDIVYVIAKASYKIGAITTAELFTRTTPGNGIDEITICRLTRPGGTILSTVVVPTDRHEPTAYTGQAYGFMPGGSVADLATVVDTTAEVAAARVDINTGTTQANLNTRLSVDFNSIDNRLGRSTDVIQGNVHTLLDSNATRNILNISGSFGNLTRNFAPAVTIPSGGAPGVGLGGTSGAVTSAPDNIVIPVNPQTGRRFIDTLGRAVFGRLNPVVNTNISGINITFSNAQTKIVGDGDFTTFAIEIGDTLTGPDGNTYELTNITTTELTITPAYVGSVTIVTSVDFQRFTTNFFTLDSGVESDYNFPNGSDIDIQPFFPGFMDSGTERQDSRASLLKSMVVPLRDATESVKGAARFATDGEVAANAIVQGDDTRLVDICKTDGTTPFTAIQSYSPPVDLSLFTADENITSKGFVDQFAFSNFSFQISPTGVSGANSHTAVFGFPVVAAQATFSTLIDGNTFGTQEGPRIDNVTISGNNVTIDWTLFTVPGGLLTVNIMISAAGRA